MQKSFVLYKDYAETVEALTDAEAGILFKNIFAYVNDEAPVQMPRIVEILFKGLKAQLDRDAQAYKERCERMSAVRAKKKQAEESDSVTTLSDSVTTLSQYCYNSDNDTVNDTDTNNDTENVNENNTVTDIVNENKTNPAADADVDSSVSASTQKNYKKRKYLYAQNVRLSRKEYDLLCKNYGSDGTKWMIDKLNNYKGSNGKQYASDYYAIKNWCASLWRDAQRETARQNANSPNSAAPQEASSYNRDDLESFWNLHG